MRNCLHHNRERPSEIELRIVSTDISSTGENRTRVILSTCECPISRDSKTIVSADIPRRKCSRQPLAAASRSPCIPSRKRVSFSDVVVEATSAAVVDRRTIMQHDPSRSHCDNDERETFYDIWQADDSVTGRSDDGYENTPRINNYSENRVSGCNFNKGRDLPENIDETVVSSDERARDVQSGDGESEVRPEDHIAENAARKIEYEHGTVSHEDVSNSISYKDVTSVDREECRMRGGCGGCCGTLREK
ncbi:hypothetical protein EAI_00842 [Harpegnathos saltator]|uniref:Uncharacterized protein n=1 Tax=Harpegnathos saltator TaxID=610380 RepID=E2BNW3_HARSA|nr:hypothetical protein EAI_00842 [Harpegnathos saltator]